MNKPTGNPTDNRDWIEHVIRSYIRDLYQSIGKNIIDAPEYEIYIVSYEHIANNWRATATTDLMDSLYFVVSYEASEKQTRITVYRMYHTVTIPD